MHYFIPPPIHTPPRPLPQTLLQCEKLTLTTRPSLKPESFSESPGVKKWIENYLWVGETMMDQSVALMGSSGYFERKR